MTRTLSASVNSYLSEAVVDFRVLAHVTFASTTMRLHTGIGELWVGSNDYIGVGALGSVEKVGEDVNVFNNRIKLKLSAVDSTPLTSVMSEALFNNDVLLYRCWLRDGVAVNTAELWYKGKMSEITLHRGDSDAGNWIEVECETRLNRRSKVSYYTKEDMMTAGYSGDTFFNYTHMIPFVKATWGNRAVYFKTAGLGADDGQAILNGMIGGWLGRR